MPKLCIIIPMIFVASCAKNTPLPIDAAPIVCAPIYGRAHDWDVISDDLARNIFRHNQMCEQLKNQT